MKQNEQILRYEYRKAECEAKTSGMRTLERRYKKSKTLRGRNCRELIDDRAA